MKNLFIKSTVLNIVFIMSVSMSSCKNDNQDFPDYEGGVTAYFAHQYPTKTITLGYDSEQDNSLDNEHKCQIFATHGGAYKSRDLKIEVAVDPSLTENLKFPDGSPVKVMPQNYYSLESNILTKKKDYLFGTTVNLTDDFFADPEAIKNTYVIPLIMVNAYGADHILTGTPLSDDILPVRTDASCWSVKPQDYILYCVKYVNPYHGSYLRRGIDMVTLDGVTTKKVRHAQYVEKDEVVYVKTASLNRCDFEVSTIVPDGESVKTIRCNLRLEFSGDEFNIISTTDGITASGTGKFVKSGEKDSWDGKDRDALYMEYRVDFGPVQYVTTDTLVARFREIKPEMDFNPTYIK